MTMGRRASTLFEKQVDALTTDCRAQVSSPPYIQKIANNKKRKPR